MNDRTRLPSAAEALTQAYERLQLGSAADAEVWIALAREIREGTTSPLITKWLEASRPGDRLTLHDVEGIVCAHGRVAIRRKGDDAGRWYLHTDDGTNCERHDAPREHLRRISEEAIVAAEDGRTSGVLPTVRHRPQDLLFGALPKAAARHYANDVMTAVPHEPAKVVPVAEGFGTTQTMPRDFRGEQGLGDVLSKTVQLDASQLAPGRGASAGLCEHCHFEIYELPAEGPGKPAGYRHTMTGQAVCHVRTQPGRPVTFATPRNPQVASGE